MDVAIVGAAHQPAIRSAPASEVVRSVVRTPPRAAMIQAEIESILHYAVSWNSVQESAAARRDLLDSWRQVAETLLSQAPADLLPASSKQQILLQLLQSLLNKVSGESLVSGMDSLVSSTVLLLMTSLRQTYSLAPDKQDIMGDTYVGILDSSAGDSAGMGEYSMISSLSLHNWYFANPFIFMEKST